MKTKILIVIGLLTFLYIDLSAQYDPHFTQYMWNEMYVNPAYAGSREAVAINALYRNQWLGMEGSPKTQTISANSPLFNQTMGLGFNLLHESIGIMGQYYASGVYAYRIKFPTGKLSMGLSAGILHRKEDYSSLNTIQENDPHFMVNPAKLTMFNSGIGAYWYTDRYYVGFSIPRMIDNVTDVTQNDMMKSKFSFKSLHNFITGGYVFNLENGIKIKPTGMLKMVYGAPVEMDISCQALLKEKIWAGLAYRTGDALSLLASVHVTPEIRVGYAYDYATTALHKVTSGTHELFLGFDLYNNKSIVSPRLF